MSSGSRRTAVVVVVLVAALVAVAAVFAVVALQRPADPDVRPTGTGSASPTPTGSRTAAVPEPSPTTGTTQQPPATPEPTAGSTTEPSKPLAPAAVTLTFSGWDAAAGAAVVGGFVEVLEPAGSCRLTLSRGSSEITTVVAASPDATTMACGELSVPRTALTTGSWQAVLSYSSATSAGSAPAVTIEVP
ncbi:hypothetical protein [uncultured Cellulomonas sp.]|uniref:hypothetical protein n=1 Tax=uncultured Cellulomonas sp. TaxID=189682 RepID=UPI0028E91F78|nr:hypothetical protein [uncultured Cellulomonas sp.]